MNRLSYPASSTARHVKTPTPPARWSVKTQIENRDREVARSCDISPAAAAILRARGHKTAEEICRFFNPSVDELRDPFLLPDIEPAVARLHAAIENKEAILVFGDYDVDGVTSTALLVRALKALGANVEWLIPERHDGYGLSVPAIEDAASRGIKLVFSADCGIGALEPAKRARELGLDLIITDHHEPGEVLPDAIAVVNPKREDSQYGFRELSGCGVAFKVLQALLQKHWPRHAASFQSKFIELVGLAAIADCVPLTDENRYLAREGLRALAATNKPGLQALMRTARLKTENGLTGKNVGFTIAPRLNAAGRVASAQSALQLLLSTDLLECEALAEELETLNRERQDWTSRVMHEATVRVLENPNWQREMIIVVAGEGWPHGVVGLVAGRLAERFCRPAIALSIEENGIAKGSGRSSQDFDLTQLIQSTQHLLETGGGHAAACGLSLRAEKIDEFRAAAIACAGEVLAGKDFAPQVEADCEVSGEEITRQLVLDLMQLEPCGMDNPEATLMLKNAQIVDGKAIGKEGEHLKWFVRADGRSFDALWWRPGENANGFAAGQKVDLCIVPELNEWNGNERIQLIIKAARRTDKSA
jgi:single-stranded-DNA-specific exonuclease